MIVGLCGPEGAGKSTAANLIKKRYGARVLPFAAPLKRMLASLGVPDRNLYGSPEDKLEPLDILGGRCVRYAAQRLGTEWGRDMMDKNFWVRAWEHVLEDECDADDMIVSDDVRFTSEKDAIERRGGVLICVVRSFEDFKRVPKHTSEDFAALAPYADILVNDSTPFALERALEVVIDAARPSGRIQSLAQALRQPAE